MARYRFVYKGIMCDTYEPSNGSAKEVALLLYGFPATIGENAATDFLRANGFLVLQPHYPGTYDSEGAFTPQSAVDMVSLIAEALSHGNVHDVKRNSTRSVPGRISVCVGYSFGCIVALRSLPYLTTLRSLLLVSPAISYGKAEVDSGFEEEGPPFIDYVRRSRPFTYRLGDNTSWDAFYNGAFNRPSGEPPGSLHSVLGLVGSDDSSFDLEVLLRNFDPIVRTYVGRYPGVQLLTVEGAGHSINDLITESTSSKLVETLG
jgi:pimeloyl-ACP methyl ester carboxylesterase